MIPCSWASHLSYPTPTALISSWPTREAATAHEVALETLVRLNLFQGYRDKLGQQLYRLHDAFRDHICASGSARCVQVRIFSG